MKIGSLFSGIGGIELGFEEAGGFQTGWFIEYEPYARAILRKHWPNIPIYGDITTIDFKQLPRVDILTGGFPCQDISNAGKRAGIIGGKRSSLWKYYLEAIRQIRPKYAVIENVSALTSRGLGVVLADLTKEGYNAEWTDIRAADVGAPHKRERIFILAHTHNARCDRTQQYESDRNKQTQSKGWQDQSFDRIGGCSEDVAYPSNRNPQQSDAPTQGSSECPIEGGETKGSGIDSGQSICRGIAERGCNGSGEFQGQQIQDVANSQDNGWQYPILCQPTMEPIEGGSSDRKWTREDKDIAGWWATEPNVGRVVNGVPFRVDRIKCLGNAVVPQCAKVIAEAIKEFEKGG